MALMLIIAMVMALVIVISIAAIMTDAWTKAGDEGANDGCSFYGDY